MARKTGYRDDLVDGLKAMEVGAWAQQKHDLLAKYIEATRYMRRRWPRRTYVELFCGPGRVWYKSHGPFGPGSALRAWEASKVGDAAFTEIYINDLDLESAKACQERLLAAGAPKVTVTNLRAELAGPEILSRLGNGLHLALLDPFSIGVLPFKLVELYAAHPRMDLVVNYSLFDVQRNLLKNLRGETRSMDAFCPGWREAIQDVHGKRAQRGRVLERWLELVNGTGAKYSKDMPLVRDTHRRLPLYYLVFAAHHDAPVRVWSDIARDPTRDMFDGV
jgi:three-Cys-motif partner protein